VNDDQKKPRSDTMLEEYREREILMGSLLIYSYL